MHAVLPVTLIKQLIMNHASMSKKNRIICYSLRPVMESCIFYPPFPPPTHPHPLLPPKALA